MLYWLAGAKGGAVCRAASLPLAPARQATRGAFATQSAAALQSPQLSDVTTALPRASASARLRVEERERWLSPYAAKAALGKGRATPEAPSDVRGEYQRDRDRVIHSKAFRRLKHKTQVFIAPRGDHYATRLTHTLVVAQIARTIARALNLNEDLAEAIASAHDLGHTPFGHIGEDELNKLHPGGFRHSRQSLRIVERVEKDGRGLNLTWETRQGILHHSKPRGDFLGAADSRSLTLEAQIVRVSDAVAYLNHDLADAFRGGVIRKADLPRGVLDALGDRHSRRIDTIVCDIIDNSFWATGCGEAPPPDRAIGMSCGVRRAFIALREFMFRNVYLPQDALPEGLAARRVVGMLYRHYSANPDEIPPEYALRSPTPEQAVADYVSGMTDFYAIRAVEGIEPGIAEIFAERLL